MDNKISVIIPAYNIEQYISKTLESVMAQTYTNIEIIVVNDGSKDKTGSIIESFLERDSRIKVIHKENGGVTSARLRGVKEASGEWIGFVDGDDIIETNMYERLIKNALYYQADISHCGYQIIYPNEMMEYYYNTNKIIEQERLQGCRDLLMGSFVEPGLCIKLYRKHLFEGLSDKIDSSIKINEDLLMNYYLFKKANRSIYEDFCPYHYVLRKGSAATSKVNKNKLWDPLKVTRIILEDAPEEIEPIVYNKLVRILIGGATMNVKSSPELVKPYRNYVWKELRKRLFEIITGKKCVFKLKIMALWAAIWPASYRWVHRGYMRFTGIDKKYKI